MDVGDKLLWNGANAVTTLSENGHACEVSSVPQNAQAVAVVFSWYFPLG